MHRQFKKLLNAATGESAFVIAIILDVRGFSEFSTEVESPETAMYVKRVYSKALDDYFPRSSFFKPTGDGLLVIQSFTERTLQARVRAAVHACTRLIDEFDLLTAGDPMVNFPVPKDVGIGLTRGAACRLTSRGLTLDYSGKVLNMASRLMNLARPRGLVFDSSLGPELLEDDVVRDLETETVFIRGISEESPVTVYYTGGVVIPESVKRPLTEVEWQSDWQTFTFGEIKGPIPVPNYFLKSEPADPSQIAVKVDVADPRRPGRRMTWDYPKFEYSVDAGRPSVRVYVDDIPGLVKKWGVRRNDTPIRIGVWYPKS